MVGDERPAEAGAGSGEADPFGPLLPGTQVGRYEIIDTLGHGGFGITYRARDLQLRRDVALKEYLPTSFAVRQGGSMVLPRSTRTAEDFAWGRERFLDEARTLATLEDAPGIVNVYDFMEANGTAYMVMALVRGETVDARLRRDRRLSPALIEQLVHPLLDGLERVHGAGFLHRDIKPANILIGHNGRPTLIDFGASRAALQGRTQTLTAVYTPGYAAFEQSTSARQGPWTDIYGLAATLYHCVTGERPPSANDRMIDDRIVPAVEAGNGRYPPGLLAAIDDGLRLRSGDRPQEIGAWRPLFSDGDATVRLGARGAGAALGNALSARGKASPINVRRLRSTQWVVWMIAGVAMAGGAAWLVLGRAGDNAEAGVKAPAVADARRHAEEESRVQAARRRAEDEARARDTAAIQLREAEARRAAEEKARADAAARQKAEEEAQAKAEAEQREAEARRVAEDQAQAEAEARRRAEEEARARASARQKAEEEARARAAAEQREAEARQAAAEKARAEAAARQKAEEEAKAKAAAEQREAEARQAAAERARAEAAARQKAEEEAKAKAAAEQREAQARQAAAERARAEAAARQKAEEEAKAAAEQREAEARQAAAERARTEAAAREKAESEAKGRPEAEARRADGERAKSEAEARRQAEAGEAALRLSEVERKRVQVALTSLGYGTQGTDGAFGARTRLAIGLWQKSRGLPETGYLTGPQLAVMRREAAGALARYDEEQRKIEEEKRKVEEQARLRDEEARRAAAAPQASKPDAKLAEPPQSGAGSPPAATNGTYVGEMTNDKGVIWRVAIVADGRRLRFVLTSSRGAGGRSVSSWTCDPAELGTNGRFATYCRTGGMRSRQLDGSLARARVTDEVYLGDVGGAQFTLTRQ